MNLAKLIDQLNVDEGRRSKIYIDTVGKVTAGVGRNLTDRAFSDDEIDLMLSNDIAATGKALDVNLPWWRQMTDARQNVLANMCFNMGIGGLLGFTNALTLMKAGRYDAAAGEMLNSKWAAQVGARAIRLAGIMRSGTFPT
jgi:lysozyme